LINSKLLVFTAPDVGDIDDLSIAVSQIDKEVGEAGLHCISPFSERHAARIDLLLYNEPPSSDIVLGCRGVPNEF
jgi:hypothetical protein